MKGFEDIFPLIAALLVAVALFFGFTTAIRKSLKPAANPNSVDSSRLLREQRERMQDIQRQQKQLMEDQRQRIRDLQRR